MRTKHFFLTLLLFSYLGSLQAQTSLKTNIGPYPLYLFHGDDFEFHHFNFGYSTLLPSGFNYFELGIIYSVFKNDLSVKQKSRRIRLRKTWYTQRNEAGLPTGFFKGLYADFNYFQETSLSSNPDRNGTIIQGLIPSIGGHIGYTFRKNNFFIEPRIGLGIGIVEGELKEEKNTAWVDFSGTINAVRALSSSHIELNIGFEF